MSHHLPRGAHLSSDTAPEAEDRQVEIWRSMSTVQVAELISGASRAARGLALAGLRTRYPTASDRELTIRLAAITLGPALAGRVYPELGTLEP